VATAPLRAGLLPRCEAGPIKYIEHIESSDRDADEATNVWRIIGPKSTNANWHVTHQNWPQMQLSMASCQGYYCPSHGWSSLLSKLWLVKTTMATVKLLSKSRLVKATVQGKVVLVHDRATLQVMGTCQLTGNSPAASPAHQQQPQQHHQQHHHHPPPPTTAALLAASPSAVKYSLPLSSIPQSLLTLLTLPQTNHLPPTLLEPYLSLTLQDDTLPTLDITR
jgi:hypothetical protein